MNKQIYFVTGNKEKVMILQNALSDSGIEIKQVKMECPEIQDEDVIEVAKFSAKWAADKLKHPAIKNDCGLIIESLNGFPGFATKYVEKWLKADGFLKLMKGIKDRRMKYVDVTAYCEPGKEPIAFISETKGCMSEEKSGKYGWELDYIFIVEGDKKTMANYPDEDRVKLLNDKHYHNLLDFLRGK